MRSMSACRAATRATAPRSVQRTTEIASLEELFQLQRIGRCRALLIIVEIDEDIAALLLPRADGFRPSLQRLGSVVALVAAARAVAAHIDKVGGAFPGRGRVVMIGQA